MKWGVRKFNRRLNRAADKAWKANKREKLAEKIEGTQGSQFRRFISRPVAASAKTMGAMSDRQAQIAYLKGSRKLSKLRRNTDNAATLKKINKSHEMLQETLGEQLKERATGQAMRREHQMRQLNDIYGQYSKGAKLGDALQGLDESTKDRIKRLNDAVDIVQAVHPINRNSAKVNKRAATARKALSAAGKIAEGKNPIKTPTKKEMIIKAGKFATNRDGVRTDALLGKKSSRDNAKRAIKNTAAKMAAAKKKKQYSPKH